MSIMRIWGVRALNGTGRRIVENQIKHGVSFECGCSRRLMTLSVSSYRIVAMADPEDRFHCMGRRGRWHCNGSIHLPWECDSNIWRRFLAEREERYMKKRIRYTDEPMGEFEDCEGFLAPAGGPRSQGRQREGDDFPEQDECRFLQANGRRRTIRNTRR